MTLPMVRYTKLVSIIAISWILLSTAALAESTDTPQNSSTESNGTNTSTSTNTTNNTVTTVTSGPLQSEREALLKKIELAKVKGVGVQPYQKQFEVIEKMAANGESDETIRADVVRLDNALNEQLTGNYRKMFFNPNSNTGVVGLKFRAEHGYSASVQQVFQNSPAAQAQVLQGDVILQVNGHATKGLNKEQTFDLIIGKPGTKVTLTIQRGAVVLTKTLTRVGLKSFQRANPDAYAMYLNSEKQ